MPRTTIRKPSLGKYDPSKASALDSPATKAIRAAAKLIGADDPASQVMGLGNVVWGPPPIRRAAKAAANFMQPVLKRLASAPGAIRQSGNQFAAEYGSPQMLKALKQAAKAR